MPKKILYESGVHQLLFAAKRLRLQLEKRAPAQAARLAHFLAGLQLSYPGPGAIEVAWEGPPAGTYRVSLRGAHFYTRGDNERAQHAQEAAELTFHGDSTADANQEFFTAQLRQLLEAAEVAPLAELAKWFAAPAGPNLDAERKHAEEQFHDEWAASTDVSQIAVRHINEACTAPEMRRIRAALGPLEGRRLLDVGCGLGEASVYFALEGAQVTASDISPGMLEVTQRLASANGVAVETVVAAAEDLGLDPQRPFDIIYIGNTLHHVDIEQTLDQLLPFLKPDGLFVSWDPLAYNPLINIYRRIATKVRTEDEHPLRLCDIRMVQARFASSQLYWCWFSTLLIFLIMVGVQMRNPNKERFWKRVVEESDKWAPLYGPLEKLDQVLLTLFPFLRPLCWNVVCVARSPLPKPVTAPAPAQCCVCSSPLPAHARCGYLRCATCGHRQAAQPPASGAVDNDVLDAERVEKCDALTGAQLAAARATAVKRRGILDVGSGTGKFLWHARREFKPAVGLEVSPRSLQFSREALGLEVVPGLKSAPGPFDLITAWHSLEHVPTQELPGLLRELRARCQPEARFLVCVPNPDSWGARLFGNRWAYRDRAAHAHEFSRESLNRVMATAGFAPVRSRRMLVYGAFAWVQSLGNLNLLPQNYAYYRLKRGHTFSRTGTALAATDAAAAASLGPAVGLGLVLALAEHVFAREKTVHTVVYRPVDTP